MPPAVLGVGNPLRRDDGVGTWVARRLAAIGWRVYLAGPTPENIMGKIQLDAPDTLIVVDAAELGLPPGSFRRLPHSAAPAMLASTHGLPLTFLLSLLQTAVETTILIGVQPALIATGEGLSPQVRASAQRLVELLADHDVAVIPIHHPQEPHVDRTPTPEED